MRERSATLILLLLAAACFAGAPKTAALTSSCEPTELDRRWTASAPVYRSCEVDRPTTLIGTAPAPAWKPTASAQACNVAIVEFVVDTLGVPEARSGRVALAAEPELASQVLVSVAGRRYSVAAKGGQSVRQVVRDTMVVTVAPSGPAALLGSTEYAGQSTPPRFVSGIKCKP